MSGLNRIQAALVAARQETTFALIKVEAPPEYNDLGAALSTKRRSAADHGTTHKTARKLGSLKRSCLRHQVFLRLTVFVLPR